MIIRKHLECVVHASTGHAGQLLFMYLGLIHLFGDQLIRLFSTYFFRRASRNLRLATDVSQPPQTMPTFSEGMSSSSMSSPMPERVHAHECK